VAARGTTMLITAVPPTATGTRPATTTTISDFALWLVRVLSIVRTGERDFAGRAGESPERAPARRATAYENQARPGGLVAHQSEQSSGFMTRRTVFSRVHAAFPRGQICQPFDGWSGCERISVRPFQRSSPSALASASCRTQNLTAELHTFVARLAASFPVLVKP